MSKFYVLKFKEDHKHKNKYIILIENSPSPVGFLVDAQKFLTKKKAQEVANAFNLNIDEVSFKVKSINNKRVSL